MIVFIFSYIVFFSIFRYLIPKDGTFSACSHLVIDIKNTKATTHFLEELIDFLPISGYYYFFLDKPEEASSGQSDTLFNHPFFQKVCLSPSLLITDYGFKVLNAVFFQSTDSANFHI